MEKETLAERVEASKRVIEAGRRESLCLEKHVNELERKLQLSHGETRAAEDKLQAFLKEAAALLQVKSDTVVRPTQQDVLHRVESLCNKVRQSFSKISSVLFKHWHWKLLWSSLVLNSKVVPFVHHIH